MKCEQCGYEQPEARFCVRCGRMMTRIMVDEDEGKTKGAKPKKIRMNKCHRCGHEQASGRICEGCGIMLEVYREEIDDDEGKVVLCPSCALPCTSSRCRNCGERVPGFSEDD